VILHFPDLPPTPPVHLRVSQLLQAQAQHFGEAIVVVSSLEVVNLATEGKFFNQLIYKRELLLRIRVVELVRVPLSLDYVEVVNEQILNRRQQYHEHISMGNARPIPFLCVHEQKRVDENRHVSVERVSDSTNVGKPVVNEDNPNPLQTAFDGFNVAVDV
jgi:hypothetical protein